MAIAPGFQSTFLGQKNIKKPIKKKSKKLPSKLTTKKNKSYSNK
jgi:hypothetical protein